MVWVEIIKDYKDCWKVGTVREVKSDFAHVLISQGYAKEVKKPGKHKMVTNPMKDKQHYTVG